MSVSTPDPATDTVTAIATVAAVTVALVVALAPGVAGRWRRPRLVIEAIEGPPFVRSVPGGGDTYLRFKVVNKGRGPAKRVSARVTRWWANDNGLWSAIDIDPTALHWVSLPVARDRGYQSGTLDLAPGTYDFVDLHLRREVAPYQSALILDAHRTHYLSPVTPLEHPVDFIAEVVVTGDNLPTFKRCLRYRVDPPGHPGGIHTVLIAGAPESKGPLLPASSVRPRHPLSGSRAKGTSDKSPPPPQTTPEPPVRT